MFVLPLLPGSGKVRGMQSTIDTTRDILRDQAHALISAEVLAGEQRAKLENAAREAVLKAGKSIDYVSEATGLTPAEIREICARPLPLDDLVALSGAAA